MTPANGWTVDMRIQVANGRSLEELVDVVLHSASTGESPEVLVKKLVDEFGLSAAEAELGRDRALGGVVRAATKNPTNCPNRDKDPVAWISFQKAYGNNQLIATIFPQFSDTRS